MPEADFLLEVLIIALDAPAHLGKIDKSAERHVRVDGCEPVIGGSGLGLGPLLPPGKLCRVVPGGTAVASSRMPTSSSLHSA
jgi:hypothetical protein